LCTHFTAAAKGQWRTLLKGSLPRPKWAGQ